MNRHLFETNDPDLAAYLATRLHPLQCVKRTNGREVFAFGPDAALGAEAYYNGASISAKDLLYTVRRMSVLQQEVIVG